MTEEEPTLGDLLRLQLITLMRIYDTLVIDHAQKYGEDSFNNLISNHQQGKFVAPDPWVEE